VAYSTVLSVIRSFVTIHKLSTAHVHAHSLDGSCSSQMLSKAKDQYISCAAVVPAIVVPVLLSPGA
jgi:hypothetical protein